MFKMLRLMVMIISMFGTKSSDVYKHVDRLTQEEFCDAVCCITYNNSMGTDTMGIYDIGAGTVCDGYTYMVIPSWTISDEGVEKYYYMETYIFGEKVRTEGYYWYEVSEDEWKKEYINWLNSLEEDDLDTWLNWFDEYIFNGEAQ